MSLENGSVIRHYKIISAIGKGGMGEVFLAKDTKLDRKAALKILPPEFAEDADRMNRFVREAKSASALNHPNIITIYEIGESGGTHFIATEFIDGQTLSDYKKANQLNYNSALDIAIQIGSALDEAHRAGIVHRDIKPDNVMIRPNGLAKILDFGIAKTISDVGSRNADLNNENETLIQPNNPQSPIPNPQSTMPGMIIGTANYMSPEQAAGKEIDARSDIFSFGVVLYEMIAGHLPFAGETAMEMIGSILKDKPKPLNSEVPSEITKIIGKCLRKDRDERYQTIEEALTDLKNIKQDLDFQDKLERSIVPGRDDNKTQILKAATFDEVNQTATHQTSAGNAKRSYFAIGLLILILAAGFFGYEYLFTPTSKQIESIAVLPFENRSGSADSEYLSDGLAESLIFRLSQLPDLKVSPTSSVFRYKGKETDPQVVAGELGVDSVMTGRITQRGESLIISVNLIDARNNKSLWGEQYERKISELLTTQREITTEITDKLQLKLSGESRQKLTKKYTDSPEAYQAYLKGRYYWNKRTEENLNKAIEQFKTAADLDPNYGLAYAGLADCYSVLPFYSNRSSDEFLPQAKAYATRAAAIDDSLGEAHISLANADALLWNWAAAEKEFKRGLELNPNYSTGRQWYSEYLTIQGRYDEALTEYRRAQDLEPLSLIISLNMADLFLAKGDADAAAGYCQRVLELDPDWAAAHRALSQIDIKRERYAEAVKEAEKAAELSKRNNIALSALGFALARAGRRDEALQIAGELKAGFSDRKAKGFAISWIYLGLNEKDEAFAWLEKDLENREATMPLWLALYPLNTMRDDPRYTDLRKRMNLPD